MRHNHGQGGCAIATEMFHTGSMSDVMQCPTNGSGSWSPCQLTAGPLNVPDHQAPASPDGGSEPPRVTVSDGAVPGTADGEVSAFARMSLSGQVRNRACCAR